MDRSINVFKISKSMNKTQIIKLLRNHFKLEELVHPDLLKIYSNETLWNTLDAVLLQVSTMDVEVTTISKIAEKYKTFCYLNA